MKVRSISEHDKCKNIKFEPNTADGRVTASPVYEQLYVI